MTKDEFVLKRMQDDAKLYTVICVIDVIVVVAFLAMFAFALMTGRATAKPGAILIILAVALQLPAMFSTRDSYVASARELEAAATDPDAPVSEKTYAAVSNLVLAPTQLRQQVIAYGILCPFLLVGGAVIVLISEGIWILVGAGMIMLLMGVALAFLAYRAYRDLKVAKAFEEAGE